MNASRSVAYTFSFITLWKSRPFSASVVLSSSYAPCIAAGMSPLPTLPEMCSVLPLRTAWPRRQRLQERPQRIEFRVAHLLERVPWHERVDRRAVRTLAAAHRGIEIHFLPLADAARRDVSRGWKTRRQARYASAGKML